MAAHCQALAGRYINLHNFALPTRYLQQKSLMLTNGYQQLSCTLCARKRVHVSVCVSVGGVCVCGWYMSIYIYTHTVKKEKHRGNRTAISFKINLLSVPQPSWLHPRYTRIKVCDSVSICLTFDLFPDFFFSVCIRKEVHVCKKWKEKKRSYFSISRIRLEYFWHT